MSCSNAIAGSCAVPPPAGTSNALGFANVPNCCPMACPSLPIHNVLICIRVNSCTTVKIQQGCLRVGTTVDECVADYSWGQSYDSWGRKCRIINWQRKVPDDAFIRIRFCPKDSCEVNCFCDDVATGVANGNVLLKFEIDGNDARHVVDAVNTFPGVDNNAATGGTYKCIRAACIDQSGGSTGDCCFVDASGNVNWRLDSIPIGAEIVVGPMSEVFFSIPTTVVYAY